MRAPTSTYRLQLGASLTFADVRELVPYLDDLGVGDCYLSPILQTCVPDSHGYDVADHGVVSETLGGRAGYEALADTLRARGMGLLIDIVPNHMGIVGPRNAWWQDVLEHGPASRFAPFFDIDWQPLQPELRNRVLLPIPGDHYGRVLENGELKLQYEDGRFLVRYHQAVLPIDPGTYPRILVAGLSELEDRLGRSDAHVLELLSIVAALPISLNGLGVREGSYVYFLRHLGIRDSIAVTIGLLWWTMTILAGLVGGLVFVASGAELPRLRAPREASVERVPG